MDSRSVHGEDASQKEVDESSTALRVSQKLVKSSFKKNLESLGPSLGITKQRKGRVSGQPKNKQPTSMTGKPAGSDKKSAAGHNTSKVDNSLSLSRTEKQVQQREYAGSAYPNAIRNDSSYRHFVSSPNTLSSALEAYKGQPSSVIDLTGLRDQEIVQRPPDLHFIDGHLGQASSPVLPRVSSASHPQISQLDPVSGRLHSVNQELQELVQITPIADSVNSGRRKIEINHAPITIEEMDKATANPEVHGRRHGDGVQQANILITKSAAGMNTGKGLSGGNTYEGVDINPALRTSNLTQKLLAGNMGGAQGQKPGNGSNAPQIEIIDLCQSDDSSQEESEQKTLLKRRHEENPKERLTGGHVLDEIFSPGYNGAKPSISSRVEPELRDGLQMHSPCFEEDIYQQSRDQTRGQGQDDTSRGNRNRNRRNTSANEPLAALLSRLEKELYEDDFFRDLIFFSDPEEIQ